MTESRSTARGAVGRGDTVYQGYRESFGVTGMLCVLTVMMAERHMQPELIYNIILIDTNIVHKLIQLIREERLYCNYMIFSRFNLDV